MIDPPVVVAIVAVVVTVFALVYLKKNKPALDPDKFKPFILSKIQKISHDTRIFTFSLGSDDAFLGLPIGQHITFRFKDSDGKLVQRTYTPITGNEVRGCVKFVVKIYFAGVHPKFPDGGKLSQHLESLKVGDTLDMKGPKGHMTYLGYGKFRKHAYLRAPDETRQAKHFAMIAGGTGITPMLQLIKAVLRNPKDETTLSLLFANKSENDILLRDELETLVAKYPEKINVHFTIEEAPASGWKYSTGYVNKEMIESHLLKKNTNKESIQFFFCGPPPMIKFCCLPTVKELGYTDANYYTF
uniref:NADH-cytochrome b5 reductase n=2 Tax=Corethron hystrix TaxID=216773 RepID=A0A7S1BKY8_9STRA